MNELVVANNLMSMADMPREEIKRAMDKSYLCNLVRQHPTLDQGAFIEFINKCQLTGADPRLNQVYLLVHNSWNSEKKVTEPKGTTVFAYQFFIQMAQKTGELEDFGVDTVPDSYIDLMSGQEKKSITAKAWVKRNGCKYEYKARFWEFAKTTKDGNLMGNWRASPYLMLEKCAVANVMRWAFPESLSGIYTSDEISKDGSDPVPVTVQAEVIPAKVEVRNSGVYDFPSITQNTNVTPEDMAALMQRKGSVRGKIRTITGLDEKLVSDIMVKIDKASNKAELDSVEAFIIPFLRGKK